MFFFIIIIIIFCTAAGDELMELLVSDEVLTVFLPVVQPPAADLEGDSVVFEPGEALIGPSEFRVTVSNNY